MCTYLIVYLESTDTDTADFSKFQLTLALCPVAVLASYISKITGIVTLALVLHGAANIKPSCLNFK